MLEDLKELIVFRAEARHFGNGDAQSDELGGKIPPRDLGDLKGFAEGFEPISMIDGKSLNLLRLTRTAKSAMC